MIKEIELETKTIANNLFFPEGPISLKDGTILVVEINRGTLTKILPNGDKIIIAKLGDGPNGAAIGPDGFCYICNNGGFEWEISPDQKFRRPISQSNNYKFGKIVRY